MAEKSSPKNYSFFIGLLWVLTGLGLVYLGGKSLYQYSDPKYLTEYPFPFTLAISKICTGIFATIIGMNCFNIQKRNLYIILPLAFVTSIYFIMGIADFGLLLLQYSAENLLLIILLILTWKISTEWRIIGNILSEVRKEKRKIVVIIILGLFPLLLSYILDYHHFNWLH